MAARKLPDSLVRFSRSGSLSDVQHHMRGVRPFKPDKVLIAAKSAKIAQLLKEYPHRDISTILKNLNINLDTFELVVRFCHGLDINLSPDNVIPLYCVAYSLGMTERQSPNNLQQIALTFFKHKILPGWNESLKALKSSESVLEQVACLGLVDACFETLISEAIVNPRLVSESISDLINGKIHAMSTRRRLFDFEEAKKEDLTILNVQLYEPIIRVMIHHLVPLEFILGSIYQYAKTWVFTSNNGRDHLSLDDMSKQREVIEAIERLLPEETKGLIPCTFLSEMLRSAMVLEANLDCKTGLEIRIGKQLENATVNDLLIPTRGYAKEEKYDVQCVRRIMKNYYGNYNRSDISGLVSVAELMDRFIAEVASDADLKPATFLSLAEMSISATVGTKRNSDGIYRAIDLYLTSHKYLTESEKEEVCRVMDCHKMSAEAREHAAQNERLPLRVVVQVLFVGQLQLRDTLTKEVHFGDKMGNEEIEMEKIEGKVIELEKECDEMKREICNGKKEKVSMWKEVKRKFGCYTGNIEQQIKKKTRH